MIDDIFAKTDAFRIVINDVFINTDEFRFVMDDVFANTDALRSSIGVMNNSFNISTASIVSFASTEYT